MKPSNKKMHKNKNNACALYFCNSSTDFLPHHFFDPLFYSLFFTSLIYSQLIFSVISSGNYSPVQVT